MSGGYALHPEAFADLDDIRDYIAQKNLDAADRVMSEISDTIRGLVPFPHQGHRRPDLSSRPLRFTLVREYHCIRTRGEALVGCRGDARTPQPAGDGRDPARQRIISQRRASLTRIPLLPSYSTAWVIISAPGLGSKQKKCPQQPLC